MKKLNALSPRAEIPILRRSVLRPKSALILAAVLTLILAPIEAISSIEVILSAISVGKTAITGPPTTSSMVTQAPSRRTRGIRRADHRGSLGWEEEARSRLPRFLCSNMGEVLGITTLEALIQPANHRQDRRSSIVDNEGPTNLRTSSLIKAQEITLRSRPM
ncbi:hypothetical protein CRG98_014179 [Punica granatum]|uniref:Uncharacterized protein n=1 Tax=Punica granatum TaxID=22663 RepID=A0A2I0KB57_PUNGR|nr:hypothetical protein CRG98_014179 [Punica granatum]